MKTKTNKYYCWNCQKPRDGIELESGEMQCKTCNSTEVDFLEDVDKSIR